MCEYMRVYIVRPVHTCMLAYMCEYMRVHSGPARTGRIRECACVHTYVRVSTLIEQNTYVCIYV